MIIIIIIYDEFLLHEVLMHMDINTACDMSDYGHDT